MKSLQSPEISLAVIPENVSPFSQAAEENHVLEREASKITELIEETQTERMSMHDHDEISVVQVASDLSYEVQNDHATIEPSVPARATIRLQLSNKTDRRLGTKN